MSNSLVESKNVDLSVYGEYAGEGFENVGAGDLKIPIISVLQTNSPQCDHRTGVPDAKPGDFYVDVTQTLIPGEEGFEFIICDVRHVFVEWKPRESGGGLVDVYPMGSEMFMWAASNNKIGEKLFNPRAKGNQLVETYYIHLLMMQNGEPLGEFLLPLASTKIDAYRRLMTQVSLFLRARQSIPRYAFKFKAATEFRENPKGKFYTVKFSPANGELNQSLINPTTDQDMFKLARDTHKRAVAVDVKAISASTSQSSVREGAMDADEVPF